MKDWVAWHDAYDDPGSSLSRRLAVVQKRLDQILDASRGRRIGLVSLCAGDGRDVIPVLARRPDRERTVAVLVENDQELARRAQASVERAGLTSVEVRGADAGRFDTFADVVPTDVLLLCGIFGNIAHEQVHDVVESVPHLLRVGGSVIWTRGASSSADRRPEIRAWFSAAGLDEIAFDGAPETFGVGVNYLRASPKPLEPSSNGQLFTFLDG